MLLPISVCIIARNEEKHIDECLRRLVPYGFEIVVTRQQFSVKVPYFRGSLIGVLVDGKREGTIAFAPYKCIIKGVSEGEHILSLVLFGNRINTFGTLHNCNEGTTWFGPDAWRTKGDSYSYEYQCKKVGILKTPDVN